MKKILILTASFGDGHNAAARNLRDALELISDDAKVEVLDLFESTYRTFNAVLKRTYQGLVRYAPGLWGGIYSLLDHSTFVGGRLNGLSRLHRTLADILHETQPDCVVSTYPAYTPIIQEIYRDHAERPFRLITIVTDSITINSTWYRSSSDLFCVPNEATAEVLCRAGVPETIVKPLGFPVSPLFAEESNPSLAAPRPGYFPRILYVINTGKKKTGKAIDHLLEIPGIHLTITVGRDAELKAKLTERTRKLGHRARVFGWTNQMPRLLMTHHLVIGKAGGASVQEAIAARCPMIVNQIIPGQEEGNARLIEEWKLGAIATKAREVAEWVQRAFAHKSRLWNEWRNNLTTISRPDAALRIAELVLSECDFTDPARKPIKLFAGPPARIAGPAISAGTKDRMLLCDFHIHTNYSDGKLVLPEVVDFYGRLGFDCICITDHLGDPRRLIGKLSELTNFTLGHAQIDEYFEVCDRERRRAWRKYNMLVMTGIEFNKDGYTRNTSAHLLGVDLKAPISPALDLPETISHVHAQGGLAIASHPHIMKSEWGKNTLYLWKNQDKFAPLIDAWEIANRNNIFTPVGLRRLSYVANSDFHKPKHIYSWKTLLNCEKDADAVKECIRKNEHVAITLYRQGMSDPRQNGEHTFAGGEHRTIGSQDELPFEKLAGVS